MVGRNCRFLQGPETAQSAINVIRKGVAEGEDTSVCLLNYKADGTPFWNRFFIAALRNASGKITHFVGVQSEVGTATRSLEASGQQQEADSKSGHKKMRL